MVHSELGASSYSRWKACPGSVRLCRGIPKTESKYAEAGSRAHELAAAILTNQKLMPCLLDSDEETEAVNIYVSYVKELRMEGPTFEAVEQKFDLSNYYPNLFGTADYVAYSSITKTLRVVDYKHGAGVPVEVGDNKQLLYYGLGALHANKFPIEKLVLTIVQPRCYHEDGHIRSFEVEPMYVLDFVADLIEDAKATKDPNAPLKSGDHCRWCPAQGICPEIRKNSLEAAQTVFSPSWSYEPEKLSKTLEFIPQVESWCKSVREFAYCEAIRGRILPGFKLVQKRATRKWSIDEGLPQEFYEEKLMSPAQCQKQFPDIFEDFSKYVLQESSGYALVSISDNRSEVKVNKIEDAFGELT